MSVEFSEVFKYSGSCKFSPSGKMIAHSLGYRLAIKHAESLQVIFCEYLFVNRLYNYLHAWMRLQLWNGHQIPNLYRAP